MRKFFATLLVAMLALPALGAGQTAQEKSAARKRPAASAKPASSSAKLEETSYKRSYADISIGELVAEDANRWTDRMSARASVGGFVTHVAKGEGGDINIRICENPRVDGMDRARCIVAICIPKLPCDVPQVGKPITVRGITRYDAKAGTHWWEIHPVELVEK